MTKFYGEQELRTILKLAVDHNLKKHGWDKNAVLTVYKASQYEIFDNVATVISSPKKS